MKLSRKSIGIMKEMGILTFVNVSMAIELKATLSEYFFFSRNDDLFVIQPKRFNLNDELDAHCACAQYSIDLIQTNWNIDTQSSMN